MAAASLFAFGLTACGGTTTTTTTTGGEVSVIVTSPTSGSVIAGNSVTVRGTVSPPAATVQVQVNLRRSATACSRPLQNSTAARPRST